MTSGPRAGEERAVEPPVGLGRPTIPPSAAEHLPGRDREAPPRDGGPAAEEDDDLGRIVIAEQVVAKLAAQAVVESPHAGAAAARVLGQVMPGAGHLGIRASDLTARPKVTAQIDGTAVYLDLSISVRWAESLGDVTSRIRETVERRVKDWTGLTVARTRITVTDLVADGDRT